MENLKNITEDILSIRQLINSDNKKDDKWWSNLKLKMESLNSSIDKLYQDIPKQFYLEILQVISCLDDIIKTNEKIENESRYADEAKYFDLQDSRDYTISKLIHEFNSKTKHFLFTIKLKCNDRNNDDVSYTLPDFIFPDDITKIINTCLVEVATCFSNSCYISAISVCGKIIETALGAMYYSKTGKDPYYAKNYELLDVAFGDKNDHNRDRDVKILKNKINIISEHRNMAIHNSNINAATREIALGSISYTKQFLKSIVENKDKYIKRNETKH